MNTYLVSVYGRLFMVHRLVRANSRAEAAAQVEQDGARLVWITDNPEIEE